MILSQVIITPLSQVRLLVTPQNVNARDTAGRKSSPLHFAAGRVPFDHIDNIIVG